MVETEEAGETEMGGDRGTEEGREKLETQRESVPVRDKEREKLNVVGNTGNRAMG